ncbi:hypothetical protein C8R46DRAFT_90401 [Mycena filopes]|nr:hypothetical protein C8R46DRAFT_90401 [Mycena filopes]
MGEPDTEFPETVFIFEGYIYILDRTLRGSALSAWIQFKESQEELTRLQNMIIKKSGLDQAKFSKLIGTARADDENRMRRKIGDLLKKFRLSKFTERDLQDPLPKVEQQSLPPTDLRNHHLTSPELAAYQMVVFKRLLQHFRDTPALHNSIRALIDESDRYIESRLVTMEAQRRPFRPVTLQLVRKASGSGSIVMIVVGPRSKAEIHTLYSRDIKKLDKLPKLYTATDHSQSHNEFVVAQQAIQSRPDSRRYVIWENGSDPAPSELYLVEKLGDEPFILATLLGSDVNSDIVKTLPRNGLPVKAEICKAAQPEDSWITEEGWIAYNMDQLETTSPYLRNYHHQIFVPGPPTAAS